MNAKKIAFPLPPLTEQKRIVVYLDHLKTQMKLLKDVQCASSAELEVLLPSILAQAFRGELE